MASQSDLSLPDRVPEMEQYHDTEMKLLPFALYTLCNLKEPGLDQLRVACQSECDLNDNEEKVLLPQRHRFIERPLQA